jgi:hypothetical protein
MIVEEALEVMGLAKVGTRSELKKHYHLRALRFHPDKCTGSPIEKKDNEVKFKETVEAYNCLLEAAPPSQEEVTLAPPNNGAYGHMLATCLQAFGVQMTDDQVKSVYEMIKNKCKDISVKLFAELPSETALNLYSFLAEYKVFIGVSDDMLSRVEDVVQEKIREGSVVILHPTLHHLIEKQVYVLMGEGPNPSKICVPLWNQEASCDIDGKLTLIRCVPSLPNNMWLDDESNLHVSVTEGIESVLKKGRLEVVIEETVYDVPAASLRVVGKQSYVFKNKGIPVNGSEPTEPVPMSDLVIHIELR